MIYWELFKSFFHIGLFSFGGGYASLRLIQEQVVDLHGWLSVGEFTDLITISQMTPGPIAINSASFVGYRIAGVGGAIIATLGNTLPAIIICMALAYFYNKYKKLTVIQDVLAGLRPAIISLIAGACLIMLDHAFWGQDGIQVAGFSSINLVAVGIFLVTLFAIRKTKLDSIAIMTMVGIIGGAIYYFTQ